MKRGKFRRSWIKIHITGWLHGSIRWQLEPEERSVWADLICLAGECGKNGSICDNDGKPYPRDFIANQLNIPQELLDRTIAKCRHEERVDDKDDIIIISNWSTYQSEYDRQKPYREQKGTLKGIGDKEVLLQQKFGEFLNVFLTAEEYTRLVNKFGEDKTKGLIEILSAGIKSKGYRYKNHYATILNWERRVKTNGTHKGNSSWNRPVTEADFNDPDTITERERIDRERAAERESKAIS